MQIDSVLEKEGLFFFGTYGGHEFEGIWEEDKYEPPRFFAFYKPDSLKVVLENVFEIVDFKIIKLPKFKTDFYSIILKKN